MWTFSDPAPRRARQRGDMLMEALIALLLLGLLGAGMGAVATSVLAAQRDTRMQGLAVVSMRQLLRDEGELLCTRPATRMLRVGGDDLALDVPVNVRCEPAALLVQVRATGAAAVTVAAPLAVSLSMQPEALGLSEGGGPIVVGTHQ